jgi:hypothetical protein
MEQAHEKRVVLTWFSLDQKETMEMRFLSSGVIAAVTGAAMLVVSNAPASAFTLSAPSLAQPFVVAGVEPVQWGWHGRWHHGWHRWGWGGQEAFAVIREAMRGKDMVALGRVVIAKRERVIMLQPWEKGLLGMTLRYPYEVRDSKDYFYDILEVKIAPDMLKLAEHILQSKETTFDPSRFRRSL